MQICCCPVRECGRVTSLDSSCDNPRTITPNLLPTRDKTCKGSSGAMETHDSGRNAARKDYVLERREKQMDQVGNFVQGWNQAIRNEITKFLQNEIVKRGDGNSWKLLPAKYDSNKYPHELYRKY